MNKFFSSPPIWQTTGLTLIRVTVGCFLIYHGCEMFEQAKIDEYLNWEIFKNPSGKLMVYAGKSAELIAGVLLVVGLFTRIASLLLIGTMSYITFFIGHGIIWYDDQHPFLFILLGLVFLFMGGGRFSLDHLLLKKEKRHA